MRLRPRSVLASLLAGAATACAAPDAGTYTGDEIERLCIAEGRGPTEPCAVIETGDLGGGLRYALYDLRGADAPSSADDPDGGGQLARNAAAVFEQTGRRRWRPVWVDTPDDPHSQFYGAPRHIVVRDDTLLYAPIGIYGTGSYNEDVLLVRRSGSWRTVDATSWLTQALERLPPGVQVWKGVVVDPATLTAASDLWREGDPNCCPTAGRFEAELALDGERLVPSAVRYTEGAAGGALDDTSRPVSELQLEDGTTIRVPLYVPRLHATMRDGRGLEWLVLSGVECTQCDAPEQLWLATLASVQNPGALRPYPYPGEHFPAGVEGGTPTYRARAFVGACLADGSPGLVLLEEEPDPSGAWRRSVRSVTPGTPVVEAVLEWIDEPEPFAGARSCREIEGRPQYVM